MECTLSSSCFRSDPPLSRRGAAIAHLDSLSLYDLVLWTDGSVLFFFGNSGFGVFANCSFYGTQATLSFSAGPICSDISAEACALLQVLCWSRQHQQATSLLFLSYLTLALASPLCPLLHLSFYFNLSGRSGRNCLFPPPVLSGYNGSSDTCFSRETTWLISWPGGKGYLCPLLLSLVSTLLFSHIGGVLSHLNSSRHWFPRFPLRNLCSLVTLAVFSLVFAAADTVCS